MQIIKEYGQFKASYILLGTISIKLFSSIFSNFGDAASTSCLIFSVTFSFDERRFDIWVLLVICEF